MTETIFPHHDGEVEIFKGDPTAIAGHGTNYLERYDAYDDEWQPLTGLPRFGYQELSKFSTISTDNYLFVIGNSQPFRSTF